MKLSLQTASVLVALLSVFVVCAPAAANATTYTVNSFADAVDASPGNDVCSTSTPGTCTLRAAVQEANAHTGEDTIVIGAGTFHLMEVGVGEDASATGDLDFTDTATTTIQGATRTTTIIDADDIDRALDVQPGAAVSINDIGINDASLASASDNTGIGIRIRGNAIIDSVDIKNGVGVGNSIAPVYGGGIYCHSGSLELTNALIDGNSLSDVSIWAVHGGGVAVGEDCDATISRTTISNNSAIAGGGLYVATSTETQVTVTDSMIVSNDSEEQGGGMYVQSGGSVDNAVILDRVTFTQNTATSGGGFFADAPVDVTNGTFYQNAASDSGGAIGANPNSYAIRIRVAFSTLTKNTAGTGAAGGIYSDGLADVRLKSSVLAYNTQSAVNKDCYGVITSGDYNYILVTTGCTINEEAHDEYDAGGGSYLFTAEPGDNGGEIDTMRMWGPETIDIVPALDCENAQNLPLGEDARGMQRPQGDGCERGSFERDDTVPVVVVTAGDDSVQCGVDSWTDAGATATDNFDEGITASTEDTVNTDTPGVTEVTYTSTGDAEYNIGTATRTVNVIDTMNPVLALTGSSSVTLVQGTVYTDAGATVTDACDSSITVQTTNPVNVSVPGVYTVTYNATDASDNAATPLTRTVTVISADHGKITKMTVKDNRIKLTYADNTTQAVRPFGASKNFSAAVSTDKKRLVVTNGKELRVFKNGTRVTTKKLGSTAFKKGEYKLFVKKVYSGYETVVVVGQKGKSGYVTVGRLTKQHAVSKVVKKTFAMSKIHTFKLVVKTSKKQLVVTFGSGAQKQLRTWKLQTNGALKAVK